MRKRISSIVIALILFACTKEEVTPRVFPRVNTIEATNITNGGATFTAEITYSSVPITDHGFFWSESTSPAFENADKISLGTMTGAGTFEAQCDRNLEEGKKYYFRAYAVSEDHTVLGKAVEFVSLGSKAPVFKDFFPKSGTWGDDVTIVGENFSEVENKNVVKFGTNVALVSKANKDTLVVRAPFDLTTGLSTITVSVAGNTVNAPEQFQILPPVIESVTPGIGLQGTKVVITGKFLKSIITKVYFGETEAPILSWSGTTIECTVPNRPNGEVLIKVQTGTGNLVATAPFRIQPLNLPQLYLVQPATAYVGETIKLTGDFFATEPGQNTVKFDDIPATILSESKTEIEVIVPVPSSRTPTITVTCYGSGVSIDMFTLKSPVIADFSPHRAGPSNQLIISGQHLFAGTLKVLLDYEEIPIQSVYNDQVYITIPAELKTHTGTLKVVHYDEEFVLSPQFKSPWIAIPDFPGAYINDGESLVYNNNAYVGLGGYGDALSNQFWKFNSAANEWTQLNNFPGTKRYHAFSFIVNSKGYVGGGNEDPMVQTRDLWEYDFSTDTWNKLSDIPMQGNTTLGFTIGGVGYVLDQDVNAGQIKIWSYNASADTWALKSTSPLNVLHASQHFVIGNSVYIIQTDGTATPGMWKYTPSSNQWNALGATPDNFSYFFTIGSVAYAGNRYSHYKYDPVSDTWLADIAVSMDSSPSVSFSINGKGYFMGPSGHDYYDYVYEFDPTF